MGLWTYNTNGPDLNVGGVVGVGARIGLAMTDMQSASYNAIGHQFSLGATAWGKTGALGMAMLDADGSGVLGGQAGSSIGGASSGFFSGPNASTNCMSSDQMNALTGNSSVTPGSQLGPQDNCGCECGGGGGGGPTGPLDGPPDDPPIVISGPDGSDDDSG